MVHGGPQGAWRKTPELSVRTRDVGGPGLGYVFFFFFFFFLSSTSACCSFRACALSLEDTIDTTGRAFLGLTLPLHRCHDHKFDPVTTQDSRALFRHLRQHDVPLCGLWWRIPDAQPQSGSGCSSRPTRPRPVGGVPEGREAARSRGGLREGRTGSTPRSLAERVAPEQRSVNAGRRQRAETLAGGPHSAATPRGGYQKHRDALALELHGSGIRVYLPARGYAVREGKPTQVPVQLQGDARSPGPVAPRGVPRFLAGQTPITFPDDGGGRLALADWITRPREPADRAFMVDPVSAAPLRQGDRGDALELRPARRAADPAELLDTMAYEFVADGWSVKF